MRNISKKYRVPTLILLLAVVAGFVVACSSTGRGSSSRRARVSVFERSGQHVPLRSDTMSVDALPHDPLEVADDDLAAASATDLPEAEGVGTSAATGTALAEGADSLHSIRAMGADSLATPGRDSLGTTSYEPTDLEILENPDVVEQTGGLTIIADTLGTTPGREKAFLEAPVVGKARDSLIYSVKDRLIFIYGEGDLTYQDNNLKADHMRLNVPTKEIYGIGVPDSLGVMSRPEFVQGATTYTMDTITYNLDTSKAKIKGVVTQDGEGYLRGRDLKKMGDNTINIAHAQYTTCDRVDHPHFYIAMTKAKVIPGKKIITGPAYFVMEDVPIYFLGIPGGFFPISTGPQSGFIMPSYGEESRRGFFLRGGGYYFTFGDYVDLELTGDIYTLGSWALRANSNYIKRYKFSGSLSADYSRDVIGERNSSDYQNSGQFQIRWSHRQDPKANPKQSFSASVDFATAGYSQTSATTLNDHLNTSTSSSISYTRNWMAGATPINLTASFNQRSNSRDSTIAITLPNISFSVASFSPFKRKVQVGKQRWYEKITLRYTMTAQNSTGSVKERDLLTSRTLENMENGVQHNIPIQTSFSFLNGVINFSPSFNYNEVWNFKRRRQVWDPNLGERGALVELDPEFGFYRMYGWSATGSFSTKLYGMYQVKRKAGKTGWLEAVRHVVTPSAGFSYSPNFAGPAYGFIDYVQTDSLGNYRPNDNYYMGQPSMSPGRPAASVNFSLSNQIEMKVRSKRDTTGTGLKKIPLIEQLSFSGSYNFIMPGDSMNLSNIGISLRTGEIFKNFAINLSATWDPYLYVKTGNNTVRRTKDFNIGGGNFGRITSTGWTFGYTFNSSEGSQPAMNDINSGSFVAAYSNPFDHSLNLDPSTRRQYMVSSYYDFKIPWNFGFNYSVNYSYTGVRPVTTQTLGFQGNVTLTGKWGINFSGGFDIARRQFTPMQVNIARNLHCWEMTFLWIPFGVMKSYQFHIGIASGMLADIKYDKQSSRYDNLRE